MLRRLLPVLFLFLVTTLTAAPTGLRQEPRPDWVVVNEPGEPAPANTVSGGVNYLLSDKQWRLEPIESYSRYVYTVTQSAGLQDAAEISVSYSPEYQSLGFHQVRVLRGDEVIDQLDVDHFEILREERDRDNGLYDGRLTAVLHLRDVRVGDTIDYAFTRHGQNPIFDGKFSRTFSAGWSVPLGRQFVRVTMPVGRDLLVRNLGPANSLDFSDTGTKSARVLTWKSTAPEPLLADKSTPSWYVDYPYVQLGEYKDWKEIVDWARPLYPLPAVVAGSSLDDDGLNAELTRIRANSENTEDQLLAALTFVQEDIRYLGYELGEGSHRPRPAAETLASRFGDCKDKALLFCTLARALGWEAEPALVSTSEGGRLPDLLPSPYAFNHVIATLRHPDGRRLWFDATDSSLAGDLEQHASPDYRNALIIGAEQTNLTPMTVPVSALARTRSRVEYTSHGYDLPGDMIVSTTYYGSSADYMRAHLLDRTVSKLSRDYLDYYASDYPGISLARPMEAEDDTAANIVTIKEAYTIPKLWKPTEKDPQKLELKLSSSLVSDLVSKPAAGERHSPLALSYPRDTEEEVVVNLHTEWNIQPFSRQVDSPGFVYEKAGRIDQNGHRITISYVYRSKQDHVSVADFPRHLADLNSINATIGYALTYTPADEAAVDKDTPPPAEPSTSTAVNQRTVLAMIMVAMTGLGIWIALAVRGRSTCPPPLPDSDDIPVGISGWLVLPAIGLVVRVIMAIFTLAKNHEGYFSEAIWQNLNNPGLTSYSPGLANLIVVESMAITANLMLTLITAWLFFKRRREARAWMIALLIYLPVFLIFDAIALNWVQSTQMDADTIGQLTGAVIGASLWISYFLKSRRVRYTFVR